MAICSLGNHGHAVIGGFHLLRLDDEQGDSVAVPVGIRDAVVTLIAGVANDHC